MFRKPRSRESINSFYNSIATEYENDLTDFDRKAREEISSIFKYHVDHGVVMDFGSGTGIDLQWQLKAGYKIISVEPSINMRAVAKKKYADENKIIFVEQNLDFTKWSPDRMPFTEQVDGLLANFAVLNCIENIDELFEKLSLVIKPKCHLVAAIIDPRLKSITKNYSLTIAFRLLFGDKVTVLNQNNHIYHETYLHSIRALKKASKKYFDFKLIRPIRFSNFLVIVLAKK